MRNAASDGVSDGVLIDLSERDLEELLGADYDSALERVVRRILAADNDAYNGWQSAI